MSTPGTEQNTNEVEVHSMRKRAEINHRKDPRANDQRASGEGETRVNLRRRHRKTASQCNAEADAEDRLAILGHQGGALEGGNSRSTKGDSVSEASAPHGSNAGPLAGAVKSELVAGEAAELAQPQQTFEQFLKQFCDCACLDSINSIHATIVALDGIIQLVTKESPNPFEPGEQAKVTSARAHRAKLVIQKKKIEKEVCSILPSPSVLLAVTSTDLTSRASTQLAIEKCNIRINGYDNSLRNGTSEREQIVADLAKIWHHRETLVKCLQHLQVVPQKELLRSTSVGQSNATVQNAPIENAQEDDEMTETDEASKHGCCLLCYQA